MQQKLPQKLFFTIAKNLNNEDPTFALFIANEYLQNEDPLRKSLVGKARTKGEKSPLFMAASAGKTLSQLKPYEINLLKSGASRLIHHSRPIPKPRTRKTFTRTLRENRLVVNG